MTLHNFFKVVRANFFRCAGQCKNVIAGHNIWINARFEIYLLNELEALLYNIVYCCQVSMYMMYHIYIINNHT